jgi:folate-dependent phosphoribosylglycinamide formyltransferase PurN
MQVSQKWVAFFSQTGSEIISLIKKSYRPDIVITDNIDSYRSKRAFFKSKDIEFRFRPVPKEHPIVKIKYYEEILHEGDVVTLHGWLNIVPGEICERYTIYNGHPGHIVDYPELKGKDPQVRAFADIDKYKVVGSVIHRVTEEIDGGEVVVIAEQAVEDSPLKINSIDGMFNVCTALSLISWLSFFRNSDIILETELNYDGTFKNDRENCIPIYC